MAHSYFPAPAPGPSGRSGPEAPHSVAPHSSGHTPGTHTSAPPPPPPASSDRPAVELPENASATERFVVEQVEPAYGELRRWSSTLEHDQLLQRAARRKRMTIKKISDSNQLFFLSGVVVGGMDGVITSLVSHQARRISRSKAMTKRYLSAGQVPTPKGKAINPTDFSRAAKYMRTLGRSVTVKPSAGRSAQGITAGITREAQLRAAWQAAMAARSVTSDSRYLVMIEEFIPGLDVRAYVVGTQVVSAVVRVPLYVVGDGVTSLGGLADRELARRASNEYLAPRLPEITDAFLAPMQLTRDTVPAFGVLQMLTPIADTARGGGLCIDVTDQISDDLRELAVDGLWAIPGLGAAAVDLIAPSLNSAENAVVLGVNPYANIMQFHYPAYGEPRKVNDAVMEEVLERASR